MTTFVFRLSSDFVNGYRDQTPPFGYRWRAGSRLLAPQTNGLLVVTIADLIKYRIRTESLVRRVATAVVLRQCNLI